MDDHMRQLVREAVEDVIEAKLVRLLPQRGRGLPRYLTTEEAAELARVQPDTIRDWLKSGRLPRHGTARHLLVRLDQLEAFLATDTANSDPTDAELEALADRHIRCRKVIR